MKLSPLLTQFLFSTKQLNLTGIGRFILDDSGTIAFQQDHTLKEDPQLVNFIAESSGKMKSLVSADLDSHLELARQFLNIGKPYLFEGIGTLSKNKFGFFEFTQGNASPERTKEVTEGRDMTSTTENSFTDYEEMFSPKKPKTPVSKRVFTWLIILGGISLAVFGGYIVYNKSKNKKEPVIVEKEEIKPIPSADTLTRAQDSLSKVASISKSVDSSGMYRFVIETAGKKRAIFRYNFLRSNFIDVQMDTKDSILFKLYFLLPSAPADTTKKRDSLQRLYGTRNRTVVELN